MNALRGIVTGFFLIVVTLTALGWRWTATLPPAKMESARVVLALAALAALGGTACIWRIRRAAAGPACAPVGRPTAS